MQLTAIESKFLSSIKNACKDQMKINSILASVTAAQAIYESNWGTHDYVVATNNLFRVLLGTNWLGKCYSLESKKIYESKNDYNGTDTLIRVYDTYDQCIEDWIGYIVSARRSTNGPFKYRNVIGIKDYKKCIATYARDGYLKDHMNDYKDPKYESVIISFIEKYELYDWDNEILEGGTVSTAKTVYYVKTDESSAESLLHTSNIENAEYVAGNNRGYKVYDGANKLVSDPWIVDETNPMFRVRLDWEKQDSQLTATKILEDAKDTASRHVGYKVYDDYGKIIYDPWEKQSVAPTTSTVTKAIVAIPGEIVVLNNTPVYRSSTDKNPFIFLTGNYYYYDSKLYNGRVRISKINDLKYINGKDPTKIIGMIDYK